MTRLLLVPSRLELARLPAPAGCERLACGVGVVASGVSCAARLARGDVVAVLLAGLAGARDPAATPLRSLVLGTHVRNEAVGAGHARGFVPAGELPLQPGEAPHDLLPLLDLPLSGVRRGVIGTVAAASGDAEQAAGWRARHPDVLVEEMEAHAVAAACAAAGVPLAVLRAVSNACGDRDFARWDVDGALAALAALLPAALAALPGARP